MSGTTGVTKTGNATKGHTMVSKEQVQAIRGGTAVDQSGDKIGSIGEVYLDDQTGQPAWITVNTGFFGTSESFVPLQEATVDGDTVQVPYTKDQVKDAPRVDADQHLDVEHEQELYRHYGLQYGDGDGGAVGRDGRDGQGTHDDADRARYAEAGVAGGSGTGTPANRTDYAESGTPRGHGDSERAQYAEAGVPGGEGTTSPADRTEYAEAGTDGQGSVTRHEEHLKVGTETREAGRVRLRKYVTTETETVEVPVRREEVHVERVPVDGEGRVVDGDPFEETETEVQLHEEVPVVSKEARAVEEVRLGTETVQDTQRVSEQVRKEHVDVDQDGLGRDGADGDRRG